MTENILVTRSSMPTLEEYVDEIKELWESHWLTNMGIKHQQFQQMLEEYLEVDNVELLTNGHMAIEMSIQAMGLQGEIITTPFTFASTTHAIVRNGLTPVFCDIDPITLTMDTNILENLITDKTSAILPVHVYGNICNVEEIERIAKKHHLKVIYDAAHSFGERYKGKSVASFGDASCFSFHATKVFNSIEGGSVCFSDSALGQKIYDLKNFGIHGPEEVCAVGANAKMNEFCAAMGICNLRHLREEIAKRSTVDKKYRELLSDVEGITLGVVQPEVDRNYSYFPIIVDKKAFGFSRDDIFGELEQNHIGARKYFYPLTSEFDAYQDMFDSGKTPVALEVSKKVLTLPMYADLELENVERICMIIKKLRKKFY